MSSCFYPKHECACPKVSHYPHLGGAALGMLVHIANQSGDFSIVLLRSRGSFQMPSYGTSMPVPAWRDPNRSKRYSLT
jgi:hypothetical protein